MDGQTFSQRAWAAPWSLQLWPEEFLRGWDRAASRLFLPTLEPPALGTALAARITIRGTGISATVGGSVVASRRVAGPGVSRGVYLGLTARGLAAAGYLERVARGLPVEWNEREPRYAISWRVRLKGGAGAIDATTVDVSELGCCVTWPGPPLAVGETVRVRAGSLLGPRLAASVCWTRPRDGLARTAGLRLEAEGSAGRRWRALVRRAVEEGAPPA